MESTAFVTRAERGRGARPDGGGGTYERGCRRFWIPLYRHRPEVRPAFRNACRSCRGVRLRRPEHATGAANVARVCPRPVHVNKPVSARQAPPRRRRCGRPDEAGRVTRAYLMTPAAPRRTRNGSRSGTRRGRGAPARSCGPTYLRAHGAVNSGTSHEGRRSRARIEPERVKPTPEPSVA